MVFCAKRLVAFSAFPCVFLAASCDESNNNSHRPVVPIDAIDILSPTIDGQTNFDKIALRPARTDWNPGLVFLGTVDGDSIVVQEILCQQLLFGADPTDTEATYYSSTTTRSFNIDVGLTPLGKLQKFIDLKFDLLNFEDKIESETSISQVFYSYFPREAQWQNGQPFAVADGCQRAIDSTKFSGNFEDSVFIVPGSTFVQNFTVRYTKGRDLSSDVSAAFADYLEAAASAGWTTEEEGVSTLISPKARLYVRTAPPELITSWVKSRAVAGVDEATIETAPINVSYVSTPDG